MRGSRRHSPTCASNSRSRSARREHERLKRRRRGLDFDDLLVMARDLLRDHPELASAMAGPETPVGWASPTGEPGSAPVGDAHPTRYPDARAAGSMAVEFVL